MRFKEITVRGTAYERGLIYGKLCQEEIRQTMKGYETLFLDYKGVSWEEARKISEYYISLVRDFEPDYVEEMRGIADGANVDFHDIATINCRTEIMYADHSKVCPNACTSLTLVAPATEGGHVIAAQNWDYSMLFSDCVVIVHVYQDDKPNFVMVTEGAGMICGPGVNDRGISVMLNALYTQNPIKGIPFSVRFRAMLEAETLSDAYVMGGHAPYSVGNLVATHKDGVAIEFEMDGENIEPIIPEDGVLVHTNHFIGKRMYYLTEVNHMGSSYIRLQRIRQLVKERYGKITVDDVKRFLSDHAGYPNALCDHEDLRYSVGHRDATIFSIIADLTDNRIYVAPGNPCETEFEEIFI